MADLIKRGARLGFLALLQRERHGQTPRGEEKAERREIRLEERTEPDNF